MRVRRVIAVWAAKIISTACRLSGRQGVTFAGKVALRIDPDILKDLASQVREKIFVVCGTNGKTTTNNLLCSAIEREKSPSQTVRDRKGCKVVCNHTGSNMLAGVTAAFVLAAKNNGNLDADYACIEIDEASTLRTFPHFKPDYMVLTNLFRDQLDRYGEIDITMDMLNRAIQMAPDMKIIVNADDALSTYLAMESGHEYITYGITERVFSEQEQGEQHEIREGRFCKKCGTRLDYEFYHYSQIGKYNCPNCDFTRPEPDYEASHIDMSKGLAFDIKEKESEIISAAGTSGEHGSEMEATFDENNGKNKIRPVFADYRGFYNIYNILAAYAAARCAGLKMEGFDQVLREFNPQNGRMEHFHIGNTDVILNLAKNPAGFNQNISAVMEDKKEKDIIIVINDNAQDGTDISWLWDVDFDRFGKKKNLMKTDAAKLNTSIVKKNDSSENNSKAEDGLGEGIRSITVSGIRCQDMQLRMKYVDIPCERIGDVKTAIEKRLADGCGNLYVLVNYTALFSTRNILKEMI
ncbi:MAG: MurT ligase domain-containing protein [Lachnospiraceae bacterium]|nr:MurT ligase domain-containing protein [Lachnospiraceae bacterium]